MSKYTLTVTVDPKVERKLKIGGYKLCLCKKVGDEAYNVIWSGKQFLNKNTFTWIESYAVFGTEQFKDGMLTQTSTSVQNIKFGQTCVLSPDCILQPPTGPVKKTGYFYVDNECLEDIHIGVSQALNDPRKKAPIFITSVLLKGLADLEPRVQLLVFFDKKLESQMMFSRAVTRTTEVEFTDGAIYQHARYTAKEEWEVSGEVRARLAYHPSKGFFDDEERFL